MITDQVGSVSEAQGALLRVEPRPRWGQLVVYYNIASREAFFCKLPRELRFFGAKGAIRQAALARKAWAEM